MSQEFSISSHFVAVCIVYPICRASSSPLTLGPDGYSFIKGMIEARSRMEEYLVRIETHRGVGCLL